MATTVQFSALAPRQSILSRGVARISLSSSLSSGTCQLQKTKMKKYQHNGLSMRNGETKSPFLVKSSNNDTTFNPLSPSDTIKQFYDCINEQNIGQLGDFIARDCVFDDYTFPKPFDGKKEVLKFYAHLISGMGPNMKFKVGQVCEGHDLTVAITWNMEWDGKMVPFTRGCSFFKCSTEGQRLTIKRAQVVVEPPVKIGSMALTLLRAVTKLFDTFPQTTTWFLRTHNFILQWFLRFYSMTVASSKTPFLAGYFQLWTLVTRSMGYAINILLFIFKYILKFK